MAKSKLADGAPEEGKKKQKAAAPVSEDHAPKGEPAVTTQELLDAITETRKVLKQDIANQIQAILDSPPETWGKALRALKNKMAEQKAK
jgi:hypothetical protein